jgi:hypothetical protein
MSGGIIQLASKGAQDMYLINNEGKESLFKMVYIRHTNFAQAPKKLEFTGQAPKNNGTSSIFIKPYGDLVNYMWLEGTNLTDYLHDTVFDLYIGGQKIDSQTFEFLSEAWQPYLAETYSKSTIINNGWTDSCKNFLPLHFFFCDLHSFIPIVALQYHEVEVRITWGSTIETCTDISSYANYIYLDTREREEMTSKNLEIIISQTQRLNVPLSTGLVNSIDLSMLNHPVKTLFFGIENSIRRTAKSGNTFTFSDAELQLNGSTVFEKVSPLYFHVVQGFYHTENAVISWNRTYGLPQQPSITLLYMYNFCLNSTSYRPTGTCNFSRIDNAKLLLNNVISNIVNTSSQGVTTTTEVTQGVVYAVNYNVLKIQNGLGGILFGN